MKEYHPQSPEARRKRMARLRARSGKAAIERAKREIRPLIIAKRVGIGLYDDGFIHAGNLAYLSLLALFPFFILAAASSSHAPARSMNSSVPASAASPFSRRHWRRHSAAKRRERVSGTQSWIRRRPAACLRAR